MRGEDVTQVTVDLEVDGMTSLHIMLVNDGSVRRAGRGDGSHAGTVIQGVISPDAFDRVRSHLTPEVIARSGRFTDPHATGTPAALTVTMSAGDEETGVRFEYGSTSLGPPPALVALVQDAVEGTDTWYASHVA